MVWMDVVGFEGQYEVSENGIVYSKTSGKRLSTKKNNRGYVQIHLYKNCKCVMKLIHRIVAEAFMPNEKGLPQINHKDENKDNNHYTNLEWCTNRYNRHYGTGYQRSCDGHDYKTMGTNRYKPVEMRTLDGKYLKTYPGAPVAQIDTGIGEHCIRRACRENRISGGYRWVYCEQGKQAV